MPQCWVPIYVIRRTRMRRTAEHIIEIGRDLLSVKDRLPHGSFLPWIEAEFDMSERSANRFMDAVREYGSKSANVAGLSPSALYEVTAPKTPPEVREEVERLLAAGEVVKRADVDALRREAEAARKAAERAGTDADAAERRAKQMEATPL